MYKPRFNRSNPKVVRANNLRHGRNGSGRLSGSQANQWKPVSIETLGYLAATAKIGILQVHQRLGDKPNKKFAKAFLNAIDLYNPSKQDMDQIQLFSHLLFV